MRRYLETLGSEGWELTGVHPLVRMEASYFILKRPLSKVAEKKVS